MRWGGKAGLDRDASASEPRPAILPTSRSESPEADRLSALAALVDKLSQEVDGLESVARQPVQPGPDRRLAATDRRFDAPNPADSVHFDPPRPAPSPAPTLETRMAALGRQLGDRQTDRLGGIEARLGAIAEQIAAASATPKPRAAEPARKPAFQSAIAEISARQRRLDDEARRGPNDIDALAIEDAIGALREDIAAIGRRLSSEIRRVEEHGPVSIGLDDGAIATLRSDIFEIRRVVEQAAQEKTLATLEAGYGHIVERLDDIVRRIPGTDRIDAVADEIIRLAAAIDRSQPSGAIEAELEDIRNALASMQTAHGNEALQGEVAALRQTIDNLARRPAQGLDTASVERSIAALRGEIEDFARQVTEEPASLTRLERDVSDIRTVLESFASRSNAFDTTALTRLEDRLDALVGRFDALSELPTLRAPISATALDTIGNDLRDFRQEFAAKPPLSLDTIEAQMRALMRRFDELPSRQPIDPRAALDEIRSDIGDLRQEIAAREPVRLDSIEAQMQLLVRRIDEAANQGDGEAFARLESQLNALADQFNNVELGPEAVAKIEADLDRIHSLLGGSQEQTVAAARDAARSAVQEFAGNLPQGDEQLVNALRGDLRALQDAAARSDRQTQQTLEAVHDTLAKVVGRIAELESDVPVPPAKPARSRSEAAREAPEDHRPLAPGSGKPSLSAFREPPETAPAAGGDRKADFIAAARRAAQAAQAEQARVAAEPPAAEDNGEPRSGTFAKLGQALLSRRRPLVLAMAAVVLALGAMQFAPKTTEAMRWAVTAFDPGPKSVTPIASDTVSVPTSKLAARLDPVATGSITVAAKPSLPTTTEMAKPDEGLVAPNSTASSPLAFAPTSATTSRFSSAPDQPSTASFTPAKADPTDTLLSGSGLLAAAGRGDAAAEFELGRRLAEGDGMRQDLALAANWYERSAKAGIPVAQYRVGSLYERGEGVKRDTLAAQSWYEKAAAQGNAQATHNLAVLLSEGANGQPDYPRASALFLKAGDMGIADSQYNLGVLYARGLGVGVDLVQSYKWFALAAAQGDADAGKRRDEVAKAMQPDQLAAARAAVKGFRPDGLNAAANDLPAVKPEWQQAEMQPAGKLRKPAKG